jgi:hypothetical protein
MRKKKKNLQAAHGAAIYVYTFVPVWTAGGLCKLSHRDNRKTTVAINQPYPQQERKLHIGKRGIKKICFFFLACVLRDSSFPSVCDKFGS